VAGRAGAYDNALMPESRRCPAAGTVTGVAVQRGWDVGYWLGVGFHTTTGAVAGGAIARGAAEDSLHMAGLATRFDMASGEGETGCSMIKLQSGALARFVLGKTESATQPGHGKNYGEHLDHAANHHRFPTHKVVSSKKPQIVCGFLSPDAIRVKITICNDSDGLLFHRQNSLVTTAVPYANWSRYGNARIARRSRRHVRHPGCGN
jgi:hypothetical protein